MGIGQSVWGTGIWRRDKGNGGTGMADIKFEIKETT